MFSKCWGLLRKLHGNCCHYHVLIKPTKGHFNHICFSLLKGLLWPAALWQGEISKRKCVAFERKWELMEIWVKGHQKLSLEESSEVNRNWRPKSKLLLTLSQFFWTTFMNILTSGSRHEDTLTLMITAWSKKADSIIWLFSYLSDLE